jgi:hypothetical protein
MMRKGDREVSSTIDNRKRAADNDDSPVPQKRPRAEADAPRVSASKSEALKGRDRGSERERVASKESRGSTSLHPTTNGRSHAAVDHDRELTASPRSTIQVNGSRLHADSPTSTPRKGQTSTKSLVPDLLSPLHPSFERELSEHEQPRKRPAGKAPLKTSRTDGLPTKKHKSAYKIPALLSPTLPPIIEAELARLKKTPSKEDLSGISQLSDSPGSAKKSKGQAGPNEEDGSRGRKSRIVVLKVKKTDLKKRLNLLLSLPSKGAKEALKKERSMSVEGTPPPPRKHPRPPEDDMPISRKPKTSSENPPSRAANAPSTPLKHASTAMSRVTSSQSQGNTPGTLPGHTPGTGDRPPVAVDTMDPAKVRQINSLRKLSDKYQNLGRELKHARDDIMKNRNNSRTGADERRVAALHFEMVLSFMLGFSAFNKYRALDQKVADLERWESLIPHLRELKTRATRNRALRALAAQMHAVCLEEITHAFLTLDPQTAPGALQRWRPHERLRVPTWTEAMTLQKEVEDRKLVATMGPWTTVDEAVSEALTIMSRWADRERVNWRPTILRGEQDRANGTKG